MTEPVCIVGSTLSPYVRKVLVMLDLKGVAYVIDPIVPFLGDERFSALSPLRRVPVLVDDRVTLSDSSVICQYLEDRYPKPALYPADIAVRAGARWLEEYADSRLGDVFVWGLFNERAIKPFVWGRSTDTARVERILRDDVPAVLDYLETQAPAAGFLCGELSIADISIAAFFRTAALAGFTIDVGRWPLCAAHVERVLGLPAFVRLRPFEDCCMRSAPANHRSALAAVGAPLSDETFGTATPRPGFFGL